MFKVWLSSIIERYGALIIFVQGKNLFVILQGFKETYEVETTFKLVSEMFIKSYIFHGFSRKNNG